MEERPQEIEDVVRRIVADYDPDKVILFGSHAYGEPDEKSDIDLLIIKETDEPPMQRWMQVKRLLRDRTRKVSVAPIYYGYGTHGPLMKQKLRDQVRFFLSGNPKANSDFAIDQAARDAVMRRIRQIGQVHQQYPGIHAE